jgi:hypothetical protein
MNTIPAVQRVSGAAAMWRLSLVTSKRSKKVLRGWRNLQSFSSQNHSSQLSIGFACEDSNCHNRRVMPTQGF